jgi:dTDP-4-dehydrorhamnose reductase
LQKICVIGTSGFLGNKLILTKNNFQKFGTYNQTKINSMNTELIQIDITKFENCEKILEINPDFVINTSAITDVDYCEKFKEQANLVNVVGVKNLVKICKKLDCKLVHFSTDGIFNGKEGNYVETDEPNPINHYGKTKLESENEIKNLNNFLILRTNLLYGYVPKQFLKSRSHYTKSSNFLLWVLSELKKNNSLRIVNDQFSNPTLVDNLVDIIFDSLEKDLKGIYHSTDLTCLSRFEFAKKIAKKFGFSENLITEISSKELNQYAPRPTKTCLNCTKIQKTGITLYSLEESLDILFNIIQKEDPELISSKN